MTYCWHYSKYFWYFFIVRQHAIDAERDVVMTNPSVGPSVCMDTGTLSKLMHNIVTLFWMSGRIIILVFEPHCLYKIPRITPQWGHWIYVVGKFCSYHFLSQKRYEMGCIVTMRSARVGSSDLERRARRVNYAPTVWLGGACFQGLATPPPQKKKTTGCGAPAFPKFVRPPICVHTAWETATNFCMALKNMKNTGSAMRKCWRAICLR